MIHPSTNVVLSTALLLVSSITLYVPSVNANAIDDSIEHISSYDIDPLTAYKQQRNNNIDNESRELNGSGCSSNPNQCGCPSLKMSDYRGDVSVTKSGTPCKAWPRIEDNQGWGLEDGAFCRNPHHAGMKPWCFKQNGNWEYCNVEECVDATPKNLWIGATETESGGEEKTNHGPGCVSVEIYDAIAADFTRIADGIQDEVELTHFIGGPIRLVAHDFMDYDKDADDHQGSDGCIDWTHQSNSGLETIWNSNSAMRKVHRNKYSDISKADFWIVWAHAALNYGSQDNVIDMKDLYFWGRKDATVCRESGSRLPSSEGCQQVEDTFIKRMDLDWPEAVALMGAHTLGLGHKQFSGHEGKWVPNHRQAIKFDKGYFEQMVSRAWTPRNNGGGLTDWTTGSKTGEDTNMMLNTDLCFFYDIDDGVPCCTRTDLRRGDGSSRCLKPGLDPRIANRQCKVIDDTHPRWPAARAAVRYLGGRTANVNNDPWYNDFKKAWTKATMNGHWDLKAMPQTCS